MDEGTRSFTIPPILVRYTDAHGRRTERAVAPTELGPDSFRGRCALRRAERTFVYARVTEAIDLSTGEIIPGPELSNHLKGLT